MLTEEDLQNIRDIIEDVINKPENMKCSLEDNKNIKKENLQMVDEINKVLEDTEKWNNDRQIKKKEIKGRHLKRLKN